MSTTTFSASSANRRLRGDLTGNLDAAIKQVQSIGRAVGEIANAMGGVQPASLRQVLDNVGLSALPLPSLSRARACRLPECHCPPPDLGEVRKVVDRPEKVSLGVRLRNATGERRTFALAPGAMMAETGETGGAMSLSPSSVELDPGGFSVLKIAVDASQHRRGVDYVGAVRVTSKDCEDMTLTVAVMIEPELQSVPTVDLHCCCHPKVRPLRWYHHYYCDPPPTDDSRPDTHDRPDR